MGSSSEISLIKRMHQQIEKIRQPTQNDLTKSALNDLKNRLSGVNINYNRDGEYIRIKRGNEQVGIIFRMQPNDLRTHVRLNSGLSEIINEFESSLPQELIFATSQLTDFTDFIFFPLLTKQEAKTLNTEIEPINGNIIIGQGEYVVVNGRDKNHLISTYGINTCRGMIIHDPEKRIGAGAHLDTGYEDISLIKQMRRDLIKRGANSTKLKFYGTPNIDSQIKQYVIDKIFSETSYNVPSDFSFDCATGSITRFDIKSLPNSYNYDHSLEDKINIRLKHNIPYIRKNIQKTP